MNFANWRQLTVKFSQKVSVYFRKLAHEVQGLIIFSRTSVGDGGNQSKDGDQNLYLSLQM